MMNKKTLLGLLLLILLVGACRMYKKEDSSYAPQQKYGSDISQLTDANRVISYLKQHHQLPDYYLTKREARQRGWNAGRGNLCEVLPGHAIGGDRFSNRQQQLPQKAGRQWFEADIDYRCGRRTADRLLFSSDGLIYLSRDHYRSFQPVE